MRTVVAILTCVLVSVEAAAQEDLQSGSYQSQCTLVAPAAATTSSTSYQTFAIVGVFDGTETSSTGYRTRLDPLCGGALGGSCGTTLCGDCNGDGVISILDALAAARHAIMLITLTGSDFANCDVDGDGDVDVLDSLLLAQIAAGLPVVLACC